MATATGCASAAGVVDVLAHVGQLPLDGGRLVVVAAGHSAEDEQQRGRADEVALTAVGAAGRLRLARHAADEHADGGGAAGRAQHAQQIGRAAAAAGPPHPAGADRGEHGAHVPQQLDEDRGRRTNSNQ